MRVTCAHFDTCTVVELPHLDSISNNYTHNTGRDNLTKKKKKKQMDESKHQRERLFSPHFCRRPNRPPLFWCPSSSQCRWFDMLSPLDWRLGFCRICSQWGQMCPWNRWSDPGREFDPWRMPLALSVSRKNVQIIKYTFPRTPKRRFTRVDSTESIRKAISCVLK